MDLIWFSQAKDGWRLNEGTALQITIDLCTSYKHLKIYEYHKTLKSINPKSLKNRAKVKFNEMDG
ncbi:hypothetical protein BEN44_20305 [Leptospira interrogans serovar Ricardi]|nr:hypothetical protein [Leptospira interrogans serovar Ricardi]